MRLFIASDHAGFKLKEELKGFIAGEGFEVEDIGTFGGEPCDYPDFAEKLCNKVLESNGKGILVCGTGQGISIAANKFKGIRASVCWNKFTAECAVEHGNANVICLGERVVPFDVAKDIVGIFLNNKFSDAERHVKRVEKIKMIEEKNFK
ncbi:MAG: ribose 5-phosphate isomerase B [Candidatus Woesearchaeota archaeon]